MSTIMQPRHIVFDFLAASTGGQMTRAHALLERLRRYDPDSRVWLLQENGALGTLAQRPDFDTIDLTSTPNTIGAQLSRMIWQNLRLPATIRRHNIDTYITFSHYLPWMLPRRVASVIGVANLAPFSQAAFDAETKRRRRLRLLALRRTILSSARRATKVIALSETCRAVLIANGISAHKIFVIPNGVDIAPAGDAGPALAALRRRYAIPNRYLLYVSHFYPYKNFLRLVQAYARLPAPLRARYSLVLVGVPHDHDYFNAVKSETERLGIGAQVLIIPGLSAQELAPLYASAHLFLYPSLIENSPNILLEAMAHGAAVLAGKHDPMPEFCADAVRYFDAFSIESMAQEIAATLADEAEIERLRARARERAARYSWDEFTARLVSLYLGGAAVSPRKDSR